MRDKTKKARSGWSGYTIDEIAYQKALTLARIEMARERMTADTQRLRKGNILLSGSWFTKIMKMVDFTDIFVIGFTLWRKLRPIFSRKG